MAKIISKPFEMSKEDWKQFGVRTLQTLAPYLIVLIPVIIDQLPKDWAYSAIALWCFQRALDLLRRFVTTTYK